LVFELKTNHKKATVTMDSYTIYTLNISCSMLQMQILFSSLHFFLGVATLLWLHSCSCIRPLRWSCLRLL